MKKFLSILLCCLMIIPTAFAAQGDVTYSLSAGQLEAYGLDTSDSFQTYCSMGDTLYILTYNGKLLAQKAGESEPKLYTLSDYESDESQSNTYTNYMLFSNDNKLYILKSTFHYSTETGDNESTEYSVNEVVFGDSAVSLEKLFDVDFSSFVSQGVSYINQIAATGDYLVIYTDTGSTNGTSVGVFTLNLTDGSLDYIVVAETDDYTYPDSLTPYLNGTVIAQIDSEDGNSVIFYQIDPSAKTSQILSTVPIESWNSFIGLAFDRENETLYCVRDGELHTLDIMTGTLGDAIIDAMTDSSSNGYILDGGYYASVDYWSYILRNVDPAQHTERKLKVVSQGYSSMDNAYYAFANEHGDVSVVYLNDYSITENLVENMMNRDSSVDVYILQAGDSAFTALYQRGYLADFTDSEKLMAFADTIDSAFLEKLSVNGRFSVLPTDCYFYMMFAHPKAFEKAGISIDEVPTNWADFATWLNSLQGRLPEGMSVFDPYISEETARTSLYAEVFQYYEQYLTVDANGVSSDDVAAILDTISKIDFTTLGQPTDEEMESDSFDWNWEEDSFLFETNTGFSFGDFGDDYKPLVMSLTADQEAILPFSASVAIINPFSANIDLALEYVETLAEKLPNSTTYVICTDKTEPTLNPYYESNLESMQEYIDELKTQLENAEEVDKQQLEESIQAAEEEKVNMERYRYSIDENEIAWMNEHRSQLIMSGDSWLFSSDSGDAYTLFQQFNDGQIDAYRFMKEVDRKVRMRILEGA